MILLDGKKLAEKRRAALLQKVLFLEQQHHRRPHLVVIIVGDNPASQVYVANKAKACEQAGIRSTVKALPNAIGREEFVAEIQRWNKDPEVDGILVQLPLPGQLSEQDVVENLSPQKDPDVFTAMNLGKLWMGQSAIAPCTPMGVMHLLNEHNAPIAGARALVVGRSLIVGKPMAHLLQSANATVTVAHSHTKNLPGMLPDFDLVVVALGQRQFFKAQDFKAGAWVVDVGIHRHLGKIQGDVDPSGAEGHLAALSPVPGGVGPMTIATLLENVVKLAEVRWQAGT